MLLLSDSGMTRVAFSKSTLEPSGSQDQPPNSGSTESSPRRLHTAKSSRQNSPTKSKSQTSLYSKATRTSRDAWDSNDETRNALSGEEPPGTFDHGNSRAGVIPTQRPSVADLRKSFEQRSGVATTPRGSPQKPHLQAKSSSIYSDRQSKESLRSGRRFGYADAPAEEPPTLSHTGIQLPYGMRESNSMADMRHREDAHSSVPSQSSRMITHTPTASWMRSTRSRRVKAQLSKSSTRGNISLSRSESVYDRRSDQVSEVSPLVSTVERGKAVDHSAMLQVTPSNGARDMLAPQLDGLSDETITPNAENEPRIDTQDENASRPPTKVSEFRSFFDLSSIRGSSPGSIISFRRRHARADLDSQQDDPIVSNVKARSMITLNSYADLSTVVLAPELTTKISTNDFSCDFDGHFDDPVVPDTRSEHSISPDRCIKPSPKKESPLKEKIQLFEKLNRGSPANKSSGPFSQVKTHDVGRHVNYCKGDKDVPKKKSFGGWRPVRERGSAIWRRISSSFTHTQDENQEIGGNQAKRGCQQGLHAHPTHATSAGSHPRYRKSSLFGYHVYRSSEPDHTDPVEVSSSRSPPSPNNAEGDSSTSGLNIRRLRAVHNRAPTPSAQVSLRKSFPLLGRVSSSLGISDHSSNTEPDVDFGNDGGILSRRKKGGGGVDDVRDGLPSSSSSFDPHALSKIKLRQIAAERKKRRMEEKQLRRAEKAMKREGKGKDVRLGHQLPGHRQRHFFSEGAAAHHGSERGRNVEEEEGEQKPGQPGPSASSSNNKNNATTTTKEAKEKEKTRDASWAKFTSSGFVVRHLKGVELESPKPKRPGQVRKIVNMYKDRTASSLRVKDGSRSNVSVGGGGGGFGGEGGGKGKGKGKERGTA
ncbi:hypothetical protein F4778DRAFT_798836 [Xylariomycetidae sp. FL2044]|nr:hypothetical protein F4778DRAFT_798836 [Xylariomycetidae sp. FL2044]